MKPLSLLLQVAVICLLSIASTGIAAAEDAAPRPNIVHIFVDDLGFGSVGFNGQRLIKTPNLDALAAGGMNFINAYAAPICGPSRGMLLSGFHNGHTRIDRNQDLNGDVFAASDVTVADVLLAAGYRTSAFGKHGFGATGGNNPMGHGKGTGAQVNGPNSVPSGLGYETFYGYLNHLSAHNYFPASLWESSAVNTIPSESPTGNTPANPHRAFAHDLITRRALEYIKSQAAAQQSGKDAPFYSQINFTIPHANVGDVAFAGRNRYAKTRWTQHQKNYAELVSRMDDSVGAIVKTLADPNGDGNTADSILDKTLIFFTSDNGPTRQSTDLATLNFFQAVGDFRGTKRDVYEGGIHVPAIAYWRGTIKPGTSSKRLTDLADFLPTAAELAGVDAPVGVDGVSLAPLLTGDGVQRDRDVLIFEHHESGGEQANSQRSLWAIIHRDGYKLIRHANGDELFNLKTDPGESKPLSLRNPRNKAVYDELLAIALAEGVEADRNNTNANVVSYRHWTGTGSSGAIADAANWSGSGMPSGTWSAVIDNTTTTAQNAQVVGQIQTLGFEVRGSVALQRVDITADATLTARNELRIAQGGHLHLDGGSLDSNRWIDIHPDATLSGSGTITGDLYAMGRVLPGGQTDTTTAQAPALAFDFTGVQDDGPLRITAHRSKHLRLRQGLDFGLGTEAHDVAQAGNEFNMRGFNASTLAEAIENDDYIGYTIDTVGKAEVQINTISFNVWRNGINAARDYAILTSADGFTADKALTILNISDAGAEAQHEIKGVPSSGWTDRPIEIRLYAWNATLNGNTHLNAASLTADFRGVPAQANQAVNPQGVLTVQGDYIQFASATLAIDLAKPTKTEERENKHDQLVVAGRASLGGTFIVSLASDYKPAAGDTFLLIDAKAYQGGFDAVQLPELQAGLSWDLSQLNKAGRLRVTGE